MHQGSEYIVDWKYKIQKLGSLAQFTFMASELYGHNSGILDTATLMHDFSTTEYSIESSFSSV